MLRAAWSPSPADTEYWRFPSLRVRQAPRAPRPPDGRKFFALLRRAPGRPRTTRAATGRHRRTPEDPGRHGESAEAERVTLAAHTMTTEHPAPSIKDDTPCCLSDSSACRP